MTGCRDLGGHFTPSLLARFGFTSLDMLQIGAIEILKRDDISQLVRNSLVRVLRGLLSRRGMKLNRHCIYYI